MFFYPIFFYISVEEALLSSEFLSMVRLIFNYTNCNQSDRCVCVYDPLMAISVNIT